MHTTLSMLEKLRELNPTLNLHHCSEMAFHTYGMLISDVDFSGMIAKSEAFPVPAEGVEYLRSVSELEDAALLTSLSKSYFNNEALQAGICQGRNDSLNALEWHPSNELIIAITDMVLFLGHRSTMNADTFDSAKIAAFYVPQGHALILYSETLHFAPLHVAQTGFRAIIILPRMTNAPFDETTPKASSDPLLFAINKWMIAHPESPQAKRGAKVGIAGENILLHVP